MKKLLPIVLFTLIFSGAAFLNVSAQNDQRQVIIEGYDPMGSGSLDDYNDAIVKAVDADSTNRKTDPNVVYVLQRDRIYPCATTLRNTFPLVMKAEEGTGAIPRWIHVADSEGKYQNFLEAQEDCHIENMQFENALPDGGIQNRSVRLVANGIRGVFKGCVVYRDRGAAFSSWADSTKVYLYDCFAHNIGRRGENSANGRFLGLRKNVYADTVVIQNCTADVLSGPLLRPGTCIINYLKVDHVTSFNNRSSSVNVWRSKEAIITNNLFVNMQMLGDNPTLNDSLDTDPDHYWDVIIDFDTIWDASKVVIRNNNIVNTQDVIDMWAKYPDVYEPHAVDPLAMRALGADSVNAFFSEVVNFTNTCPPPIDFNEAIIIDQSATSFPLQFCLGEEGGFYPDEIDASYETTSQSYTAADDGFPLGDLNWWPEMKQRWENGDAPVGTKLVRDAFVQVYPNPASNRLVITAKNKDDLTIKFYSIMGRELLIKTFNTGGDSNEINISSLNRGMYIYKISDSSGMMIHSGKVLVSEQ